MAFMNSDPGTITSQDILEAYRHGLFPMADNAGHENFYWYDPVLRGQLPIETLHIPKRLQRTLRACPYDITVNHDFVQTIDLCAAKAPDRPETWINRPIRNLFITLHRAGHAHSIEAWDRKAKCSLAGSTALP